jgi:hypothetical protein
MAYKKGSGVVRCGRRLLQGGRKAESLEQARLEEKRDCGNLPILEAQHVEGVGVPYVTPWERDEANRMLGRGIHGTARPHLVTRHR